MLFEISAAGASGACLSADVQLRKFTQTFTGRKIELSQFIWKNNLFTRHNKIGFSHAEIVRQIDTITHRFYQIDGLV